MLYAYIGTAVVIVILVGSVTTCVVWLSKKVSAGIREKTVDVISAYDVLLEKRSRELAQLEEAIRLKAAEAENQTQPAAVKFRPENDLSGSALVNAAERFASASYRETAVGETYRKIRDAFQYDPQQVLAQISQSAEAMAGGPATRLLEELHYDTVYRLSTLAGEDQQRLLEEALEGDALQIEMGNIIMKTSTGGTILYDVARANQHKDRYSALSMAVRFIAELEDERKRKMLRPKNNFIGVVSRI